MYVACELRTDFEWGVVEACEVLGIDVGDTLIYYAVAGMMLHAAVFRLGWLRDVASAGHEQLNEAYGSIKAEELYRTYEQTLPLA